MPSEHVTLPVSDARAAMPVSRQATHSLRPATRAPAWEVVGEAAEDLGMRTVDWFVAGQRDWDLSMITATYSDDDPECEEAHEERESLRAHIGLLDERALRDYLHGLLSQMETCVWQGLTPTRG